MKLDIFNHIFPPKFFAAYLEIGAGEKDMGLRSRNVPNLYDLDSRFRLMDEFGEYQQVISLASPPIESYAGPEASPDLARMANDGMAELVARYPERFPYFAGALPIGAA